MSESKKCTKCGEIKLVIMFKKDKSTKSGYENQCKDCANKYTKIYTLNNKDREKEYSKIYYINNKDKINKQHRDYYINNKEKYKEYNKKSRLKHKDYYKEYYNNNKFTLYLKNRNYRIDNRNNYCFIKAIAKQYFINKGVCSIPQDLLELKINQIRLKRKIKEVKQDD